MCRMRYKLANSHSLTFALSLLLAGSLLLVALPVTALGQTATLSYAETEELPKVTADVLEALASSLSGHDLEAYDAFLAGQIEEGAAFTIATFAYLKRHLELATWLYARALEEDPKDPTTLSNLGLCLHEMYLTSDPEDPQFLSTAIALLKEAARLEPDSAFIQNNLGYALLDRGQSNGDADLMVAAEEAFLNAIELDPNEALYHSHLAELYLAQEDDKKAAQQLVQAHRLDPVDGAFLSLLGSLPASSPYYTQARDYCGEVDYYCKENCPPSIIGQINFVTCKMKEASAQDACRAGKPYAPYFDCSEEMPRFGILIPGLFAGVSIITPWGRCDVLIRGDGSVDFKMSLKGPAAGVFGTKLTVEGTLDASGKVTIRDIKGEASCSMKFLNNWVAQELAKYGLHPLEGKAVVSSDGEAKVEAGVYGGPAAGSKVELSH